MEIKAVRMFDHGFMNQAFAFGGEEGKDKFDEQIIYRSSLQNFLIETDEGIILIDTGLKRGMSAPAKKLGAPMEKFIVTLDHYGNTSSASIPLALCEGIEKGLIKRGQKIALIGFGAGLTYGGIIFEY